jgi:hypothetical protein
MPFIQHDPPTHNCLFCSLVLGRVGEYFRIACALAPFLFTPTSFDTTSILMTLHPQMVFLVFLEDFEPYRDFELSFDSFKLAFQCMPNLSTSGLFRIIFGTLLKLLSPRRFYEWIPTIISIFFSYHPRSHSTLNCTYFWGNPPLNRDQAFRWSLTLVVVGEVLYLDTSHTLCHQICDVFVTHFSPHQFGLATKGGYETIIHDTKCTLDLHLNWVVLQLNMVNVFNSMLKRVIFQNFMQQVGTSYNLSPLNLLCFTFTVTMMAMS